MISTAMTFAQELRAVAQWFEEHPDVTPPVECFKRMCFIIGHEQMKATLPERPITVEWRCEPSFAVARNGGK